MVVRPRPNCLEQSVKAVSILSTDINTDMNSSLLITLPKDISTNGKSDHKLYLIQPKTDDVPQNRELKYMPGSSI